MTPVTANIRNMTIEETSTLHLFNPGLMMELENMTLPLSAGTTDHIHTFREGKHLYLLIVNYRIGYVGVDEIDIVNGTVTGNIFLQGCELEELVGHRWQLMNPEILLSRLLDYLYH